MGGWDTNCTNEKPLRSDRNAVQHNIFVDAKSCGEIPKSVRFCMSPNVQVTHKDTSFPTLFGRWKAYQSHDKANVIGKYFAQKCSLDDDFAEQSGPFPHVRQRTANTLATVHFRQATVRRTLRALNPSKATGPDAVPARVLRNVPTLWPCPYPSCLPCASAVVINLPCGKLPTSYRYTRKAPSRTPETTDRYHYCP